jgi:flagellar biosynthesis/type III secretory pathway protein FliH
MPDAFVSLAQYLRAPANEAVPEPEASVEEAPAQAPLPDEYGSALDGVLSEIRCFRAALADALDARLEQVLCDVAAGVLARELRIEDADVAAVVALEIERAGEPPVRLRAHPEERAALGAFGCPVVADASLLRGDVVLEVRSGTIRSTLGIRLERALERAR